MFFPLFFDALAEFVKVLRSLWAPDEYEPPVRSPRTLALASDPMAGLERVECKCPSYRGSDFWNDPHRWCGVEAPKERFWMKSEARDCERTWRPVKAATNNNEWLLDNYTNATNSAYLNMAGQQSQSFSPLLRAQMQTDTQQAVSELNQLFGTGSLIGY